jgi:hypothetical protein
MVSIEEILGLVASAKHVKKFERIGKAQAEDGELEAEQDRRADPDDRPERIMSRLVDRVAQVTQTGQDEDREQLARDETPLREEPANAPSGSQSDNRKVDRPSILPSEPI